MEGVVGWFERILRTMAEAIRRFNPSASTLLGVARLGFTGQLVELDLTAALPE
jgi:hypothetical protein